MIVFIKPLEVIMTRSYPSDISRNQFSKIHLILESTGVCYP
ncbi:hypothetical protein RHABOEDO_001348 [Candidatus Rhabdochlamydia oedothoracis]|uniref:Transposase n=1 Tax=Candidatus Rhabdochlamydia oedothoracis TaxID=2720720 RepID=A0ABX8V6J7_9BACT|nr:MULTISPECIES: hypothetical protein [Rhabdochlamydia]KAG6559197.1 hypothetical protein RHOW815_000803 [Candidatus Rhabdochlamydia sp. W815]QYF49085.1 hypothetical protein RHABOEDO_001348 [Candidatus Rhabdochlamydia oedothoracis]